MFYAHERNPFLPSTDTTVHSRLMPAAPGPAGLPSSPSISRGEPVERRQSPLPSAAPSSASSDARSERTPPGPAASPGPVRPGGRTPATPTRSFRPADMKFVESSQALGKIAGPVEKPPTNQFTPASAQQSPAEALLPGMARMGHQPNTVPQLSHPAPKRSLAPAKLAPLTPPVPLPSSKTTEARPELHPQPNLKEGRPPLSTPSSIPAPNRPPLSTPSPSPAPQRPPLSTPSSSPAPHRPPLAQARAEAETNPLREAPEPVSGTSTTATDAAKNRAPSGMPIPPEEGGFTPSGTPAAAERSAFASPQLRKWNPHREARPPTITKQAPQDRGVLPVNPTGREEMPTSNKFVAPTAAKARTAESAETQHEKSPKPMRLTGTLKLVSTSGKDLGRLELTSVTGTS